MDIIPSKKAAYAGLCIAGFLTFILWRVELEYHGWAGLIWISYFHWAMPAGLLLFVGWVALFVQADSWKQKLAYVGLVIILGSGAIWGLLLYLYNVGGGWRAMLWSSELFSRNWWYISILSVVLPFLPSVLFLIAYGFRIRIPIKYCLLAQGLYWVAPFMGMGLIRLIEWNIPADLIHVFKTGYIYPFWFFAIGFPLIHGKKVGLKEAIQEEILDAP